MVRIGSRAGRGHLELPLLEDGGIHGLQLHDHLVRDLGGTPEGQGKSGRKPRGYGKKKVGGLGLN